MTRDFESIQLAHDSFLAKLLAQSFITMKPVLCESAFLLLINTYKRTVYYLTGTISLTRGVAYYAYMWWISQSTLANSTKHFFVSTKFTTVWKSGEACDVCEHLQTFTNVDKEVQKTDFRANFITHVTTTEHLMG